MAPSGMPSWRVWRSTSSIGRLPSHFANALHRAEFQPTHASTTTFVGPGFDGDGEPVLTCRHSCHRGDGSLQRIERRHSDSGADRICTLARALPCVPALRDSTSVGRACRSPPAVIVGLGAECHAEFP